MEYSSTMDHILVLLSAINYKFLVILSAIHIIKHHLMAN